MPVLFSHPSSLEHDTGWGHPERPDRIRAIEAALAERDQLGWERRQAPAAELEWLLRVHPRAHVDAVREMSRRAGSFDLDTPTSEGSWEAALHAAGGACALVEALLADAGERVGLSIARPPGHHAERDRAMGFCLFANVAVAARHALSLGAERVLVLDWDVHHGNGTNSIFHDSREVLFASIHQYPFYPGTGPLEDVGTGPGEGFSLNLPVPAGAGEAEFASLVEHVVAPAARAFEPDLVLISAGYDAHRADPVGECTLETSSFGQLTRQALALAGNAPVGAVLEGGYDLEALAGSVVETMVALDEGGEPAPVDVHPLAERAAARLGRWWPL